MKQSRCRKNIAPIANKQVIEMFDIVLAVSIGWLAITVAGHATWVIVAKIVSSFEGNSSTESVTSRKRTAIAKSVIRELRAKGRIDASTMNQLFSAINEQKSGTRLNSQSQPGTSVNDLERETKLMPTTAQGLGNNQQTNKDPEIQSDGPEILVATLINEEVPTRPNNQLTGFSAFTSSDVQQELQEPDHSPSQQTKSNNNQQLRPTTTTQQPPKTAFAKTKLASRQPRPTLSTGEIIQSFLSAHNIRWGELIAGTLIVVCSIGLVISLWGPLVRTYRAIPTLIFLAANAAIYGVGLYTLSRWRLRHTSRAVLVIATLLIPLSVLAGIAASGIDATQAIDLSDPITLVTIGLAGLVYSVFLYLGGKALTNRIHVWSIFTSVAGSIVALVFAPAAIRAFESQAGWLITIASSAVVFACAMIGE
ncbi:MAG: hypothetical protein ACR2OA_02900, partial [Rubripirellula sp.]